MGSFICLNFANLLRHLVFGGMLFASLALLPACTRVDPETTVVTEVVVVEGEERPVTRIVRQTVAVTATGSAVVADNAVELDIALVDEVTSIDPQKTADAGAIDLIENMFVGLTNFNHQANVVEPELALHWDVSRDGRIWTFHLRDDVFWIQQTPPARGSGTPMVQPVRRVVAADVVYAIQRACRRDTETPDAFILFLIEGCDRVYGLQEVTAADLDRIGIRAVDEVTLQVSLKKPASHFLTITSMWLFRPVPREIVEEMGDRWQMAENLLTSGPFFPTAGVVMGSRVVLRRNPLWPIPFQGNVDVVNILFVNNDSNAFQLWQAKSLDIAPLPPTEREEFLLRSPAKAILVTNQTVFYLGFNFSSGVFRETEVRRAFSAAIDRERLAEELYGERALPMRHLTPPGVFAAPAIDEVGRGYDPDYARQQMATSGFRSCRLLPPITFLVSSSDLSLLQAELIRRMWVDELDCLEEQIFIEQVQFGTLLANTRKEATGVRPDLWELGWASYYPDAHHWLSDLVHCLDSENRQNRPCSEVDDLIRQATSTIDVAQRLALYRQIENLFFGSEGSFPVAPLYVRGEYVVIQSWLQYTPALFGGNQYDTVTLQAELKRLERSR